MRISGRIAQRGFTTIELLAVVAVISMLIMLLLPAVQQAREAARLVQCQNNLRQIGVALACYDEAFRVLPPGCVNPTGPVDPAQLTYGMGWLAMILPQMGDAGLSNELDFDVGFDDVANQQVVGQKPDWLNCPSSVRTPKLSAYAGCHHDVEAPIDVDNSGVLYLNSSVALPEIPDGRSQTLMVSELNLVPRARSVVVPAAETWIAGTSATLRNTGAIESGWPGGRAAFAAAREDPEPQAGKKVGGFGSLHTSGLNVLLADGSVRYLRFGTPVSVLRRLANRSDGTVIDGF